MVRISIGIFFKQNLYFQVQISSLYMLSDYIPCQKVGNNFITFDRVHYTFISTTPTFSMQILGLQLWHIRPLLNCCLEKKKTHKKKKAFGKQSCRLLNACFFFQEAKNVGKSVNWYSIIYGNFSHFHCVVNIVFERGR